MIVFLAWGFLVGFYTGVSYTVIQDSPRMEQKKEEILIQEDKK